MPYLRDKLEYACVFVVGAVLGFLLASNFTTTVNQVVFATQHITVNNSK